MWSSIRIHLLCGDSSEYWSGLPFSSPGDLPKPGIEPGSRALQADSLPSEPPRKPVHVYKSTKNEGTVVKDIFVMMVLDSHLFVVLETHKKLSKG